MFEIDNGNARSMNMGRKLYVGNLGYDVKGQDLEQLFGEHGTVDSASVISEK